MTQETDAVNLALDDTGMPRHRAQIGGAATAGVLLALPGVLRRRSPPNRAGPRRWCSPPRWPRPASAWPCWPLVGRQIPQYLPYATVGLVGGATVTAVASLPTDHPTALYAAAAALLGVSSPSCCAAPRPRPA